jgi:ADP-heptose:LPS heptosyltransferase
MESNPEQLVASFLDEYRSRGFYSRNRIARLAELAVAKDDIVAEAATKAIFAALVEPLADSFEPDAVALYNRAFAQIIQGCRRDPRARQLDRQLEEYGLKNEDDLIARADRVLHTGRLRDFGDAGRVQRVIVLSRVTLGADVAITSVIIERMKHRFPAAEIVLVGGSKTAELFGGNERLRFKEIEYRRAGTTIERLLTWVDLLRCVHELTDRLEPGEYLIVDPDTRLTQLGLLPVGSTELSQRQPEPRNDVKSQQLDYLLFPSRVYGSDSSKSLSDLTSSWLDEILGENVPTYPSVRLKVYDTDVARELMKRLAWGSQPVVAINFGVGGNPLKRVGGDFEATLVARLLQQGARIVLDKGAGDDEINRADAVVREATRVEHEGRRVRALEIDEQSLTSVSGSPRLDAEILVWKGRIGVLSGLIGESDLYIGYDSAGQHIAAALGVKCIDVFAGFSSRRVLERWRPGGPAETRVVPVDSHSGEPDEIVASVLHYVRESLQPNSSKRE